MDEKRFKVTKEEYMLLQKTKKGLELSEEQIERGRRENLELNEMRIKQFNRMIQFKRDQIKNQKQLEAHADFADNKKPFFMLENEIDQLSIEIKKCNENIKNTKEEDDKAKKPVQD